MNVLTNKVEVKTSRPTERTYAYARIHYFYTHGRMPKDREELIAYDKTLDDEPLTLQNSSEPE